MATYAELRSAFDNDDVRHKVTVATVIAAQGQLTANPGSAAGRAWALRVLGDPDGYGRRVFLSVLASNKAATLAQIGNASDTAIQTAVDAVASALISAEGGT